MIGISLDLDASFDPQKLSDAELCSLSADCLSRLIAQNIYAALIAFTETTLTRLHGERDTASAALSWRTPAAQAVIDEVQSVVLSVASSPRVVREPEAVAHRPTFLAASAAFPLTRLEFP